MTGSGRLVRPAINRLKVLQDPIIGILGETLKKAETSIERVEVLKTLQVILGGIDEDEVPEVESIKTI